MKYRQLGKTGLNVSVIGLGTMQLGGEWGQHFSHLEVNKIIGAAQDCGINLIDTAECYGDHQAESLLGYIIRAQRKNWILATKFGHRFLAPFKRENHWQPIDIKRQLEASLKALQTD
jgi:aryl-alcohol dehydrogenase-like predicted oxidoreductase